MRCTCRNSKIRVVNSRVWSDALGDFAIPPMLRGPLSVALEPVRLRRRACDKCGKRWNTVEVSIRHLEVMLDGR